MNKQKLYRSLSGLAAMLALTLVTFMGSVPAASTPTLIMLM